MPLTRGRAARSAWLAALGLFLPGCASSETQIMSTATVQLPGDGPDVRVAEPEARQMAAALRAALADGRSVGTSGAPVPVQMLLFRDYAPEPFSIADQVRAGEWLLVTAARGPRWDLRMVTPDAPRIGLIFQVPLVRDGDGLWRAASVNFLRAR